MKPERKWKSSFALRGGGTPLAYILYVLSALGIMFTIGYYMYSKHKLELDLRMKQMEKQRMEEFHQTKLHLFTNFSHELRTPLTLIISPLEELMKRAEVPQFIRTQLEMILKNARRLLLLVNQLMDLQKNQSGNLTLQLSQKRPECFPARNILYIQADCRKQTDSL